MGGVAIAKKIFRPKPTPPTPAPIITPTSSRSFTITSNFYGWL